MFSLLFAKGGYCCVEGCWLRKRPGRGESKGEIDGCRVLSACGTCGCLEGMMTGIFDMRTQLWRLCRLVPVFMAEGLNCGIEILSPQRAGSSVAMEVGRSVQGFLMGLL